MPGSYVVITPARNEGAFIELTIQSMVAQTVRPLRWVVVSDGSTDGTDQIVSRYATQHPWIELLQMPERRERHFSGKVHAFNAGYERVQDLDYDVIASLDGDISFSESYFAFLLQKLDEDSRLGVVGTPFREGPTPFYDYRFVSIEHVSGACQVFRRACFEDIGGYRAVKAGGIDYIAVTSARMKGWRTRTFTEKSCLHHRPMGSAQHKVLTAKFKIGAKDYALGNHALWEVFRTAYQMTRSPYIIGGIALAAGYSSAMLRRRERSAPPELVRFIRQEQKQRLLRLLSGRRESNKVLDKREYLES